MFNATKKNFLAVSAILFLAAAVLVVLPVSGADKSRKIVVFSDGAGLAESDKAITAAGGLKIKDLPMIRAKAAFLSAADEKILRKHPGVLRIEEDIVMTALAKPGGGTQPAQTLPWGINRVDAELVWPSGNVSDAVKVAVIDTGISKDHPDLKSNIKGGYNAINPTKSWSDDNGHGSHVAGIIAAADNAIGVVGGAPLADLYAVKVLNRNGSGYLSDVIEGIQWSVTNGMRVANLSLGSSTGSQSLHDAVIAARDAGITVIAAAGNSGGAVNFPAAYPEVIAVSATDSGDNLASFSSRGPEVDLAAPGVGIYSAYKGTGYATLSGTSMAAPHAAATAALVIGSPIGAYDSDADGVWDPDEVKQKLQDRAVDLGTVGFDNLYGWGLVNAFSAVQP